MSGGKQIIVNSRKYDLNIRRKWTCRLIDQKGPLLVFVGEFDEDVEHPGLGQIKRGTISYEYYWLDRWYNIFRFHEPDGKLRNFYCNIAMPPTFADGMLDYVDLDIDVIVWPDFRHEVLDRDDFEQNAFKFGYAQEVKDQVESALSDLLVIIERREFPFNKAEPPA